MGLEWEFMQTVIHDRLQAAAREQAAFAAAAARSVESPRRRLPLLRRRQRVAVGCLT